MTSPKSRKRKPYSPPPRAGPSASRQAASRSKRNKLDLEQLMENTPDDGNKLPDLVVNRESSETFNAISNNQAIAVPDLVFNQELSETLNAITNDQTTTSPDVEATGQSDSELKGVTDTPLTKQKTSVTPENVESQRKQSPLLLQEIWNLHRTIQMTPMSPTHLLLWDMILQQQMKKKQ